MHATLAFSVSAGEETCTRRSSCSSSRSSTSSSSSSSRRPRIEAPTDISTASAVFVARGNTARLLAEAGSSLASSIGRAEEAIGSELSRRTRGKATQARQRADVCFFRAHTTKYSRKVQKIETTEDNGRAFSARGTEDQQMNVPTIRFLDPRAFVVDP